MPRHDPPKAQIPDTPPIDFEPMRECLESLTRELLAANDKGEAFIAMSERVAVGLKAGVTIAILGDDPFPVVVPTPGLIEAVRAFVDWRTNDGVPMRVTNVADWPVLSREGASA